MQEKQKVTLYLPQPLHRKLKIRAAVETEAMSSIVERAVAFYLDRSDVVDDYLDSPHGRAHRVYACPSCQTPSTIRDGELVQLDQGPSVIDDALSIERAKTLSAQSSSSESQGGELIPC